MATMYFVLSLLALVSMLLGALIVCQGVVERDKPYATVGLVLFVLATILLVFH